MSEEHLKQIVEAIESLEAEKAATAELIKERYAQAKGEGYDVKVLRKVIAQRKRDRDDVAEEEQLMEVYLNALEA